MFKWIAAFIGMSYRGFPGAVFGFFIGMVIDSFVNRYRRKSEGFHVFTQQNPFQSTLGNFEVNLLSLSSLVIKADGEVSQSELDYVRAYFVRTYGKERANATFRTFNDVVKKQGVDAAQICQTMRARTSYEMRLQILHFLFGIAMADGKIKEAELTVLHHISIYLSINNHDFESIKAMFYKSADEAYKILEVDKDAPEAEIKKSYRKMVKKYHPDRLTGMDEAYIKMAREKFDKVQEAYDKIRKERGF